MSLRILHILDHSLPHHSGYAFRTASLLREQRALGWDTLHLTTPRQGPCTAEEETVDEWLFHRTPLPLGWTAQQPGLRELAEMRATAARIDALAASWRPDVLHAHSPVLNALPALWVGRRRRVPVVYEMRASWEDAAVDHGSTAEGSLRYRLSRRLETFALRHAHHVTTICEGLRREIVARGIPRGRVTVIPNAVDPSAFRMDAARDAALAERLALTGAVVLGFAGSFYAYEGLDLLLEAAARLRQRIPRLRVLLLGGGPQEAALRRLAQTLDIVELVNFTGRVAHQQVAAYYGLIDLLVYPRRSNRLTELVTPLKPLEAMAQGRPVVASDVGGHRELIRDGVNGFLFAPDAPDALARKVLDVLARRETWPAVTERGRAFVETERNWPSSVSRYLAVYASAAQHAGR